MSVPYLIELANYILYGLAVPAVVFVAKQRIELNHLKTQISVLQTEVASLPTYRDIDKKVLDFHVALEAIKVKQAVLEAKQDTTIDKITLLFGEISKLVLDTNERRKNG